MNDLKKPDTWKNEVAIATNFISSKDEDEECAVHSNSDFIFHCVDLLYDKCQKSLQMEGKNYQHY